MNTRLYRCIGKGFCGSVWALEDASTAIKREDGGPGRSVTNDYNMHILVLQSASRHLSPSSPVRIQQCYALVQPADVWWQDRLQQFPAGYSACRAIVLERILKIIRCIGDKIVDLFCADDPELCQSVKSNPDDDACLIRPYLGRRRRYNQDGGESRFRRFSLRNVPLHIDQMEMLGMDAAAYAEAITEALAMMHWGAHIDAGDVEFVLAPSRAESSTSSVFRSAYLGTHSLWILDFDCCQRFEMDEAGVEKACEAFFKNDPFYPRPGSEEAADEERWKVFKRRFLVASRRILGGSGGDAALPERLIEMIENEGNARRRRKEELVRSY
ncbi:hypothetical protein BU23DRAFT_550300 [Bimuria novae-zelandiae CBS 107.79]|uniref:DUF3669 domain-containing protein n=1 Tax=Bimuria novae-zelandiae CBS 107.79 TaxID=1447943 RepID=A0A6A5VTP5_9PLEO|nr:hypothetical protein BU23DRAFT_550300 [Bimuria novae-zelandiae CBS 107.79]